MGWCSYASSGYDGVIVTIEVDIRRGIPGMDIVGLPGSEVREARERMRVAVRRSGLDFPRDRILVNLAPADTPKFGTAYDLPIALAVLEAANLVPSFELTRIMVLGELLLSGVVRPVPGVLSSVAAGLQEGITDFIVPRDNLLEARAMERGRIFGIRSLGEAVHLLTLLSRGKACPETVCIPETERSGYPDYRDLRGQELLKRALEVAAAGRHHILLFGPPGGGKTMAINRLPSVLPALDREEALEVSRIYSLAGLLPRGAGLLTERPFRKPHHSASLEGMVGGGKNLLPGEISLAHSGTLFLDETPEFGRRILQCLREPLEEGTISIVRANRRFRYPADFHLVLAANPCSCGNLGRDDAVCLCGMNEIFRYWRRIGGAMMDRIDIRFPVKAEGEDSVFNQGPSMDSGSMAKRILRVKNIQDLRFRRLGGSRYNGRIQPAHLRCLCKMTGDTELYFLETGKKLKISGRGLVSVLKISRTIADLASRDTIEREDLLEAFQYRRYGEGDYFWTAD